MKDFRQITFETLFEEGLTSLKEKDFNISSLSENQNLRANQLFNNTKINSERIENSIRTYSDNWSYERIGKVELITLTLGISELIMDLSPTKVIIRHKNEISIIGKCNLDAENNISCEIFEFVNTLGESKIIQFIRPNSKRNCPTYPISIIIE